MKSPTEHQIQAAFIEWCRLNEKRYPGLRLGFAVPNGGLRNKATAARLKKEGVRAGVPDFLIPARSGSACGLAIEFKVKGKEMTKPQWNYAELLANEGWCVWTCHSTETAICAVEEYFGVES